MFEISNPVIDMNGDQAIQLSQDKSTMVDTDIYSRFVNSVCNNFYRSRFYKDYKSFIMSLGFNMDMTMSNITENMAMIELHHELPSLKQVVITLTEYLMATKGFTNTFEVGKLVEETHRNHEIAVIMLSKSRHQYHHGNSMDHISVNQCIGFPERFLIKYAKYMTLDIAYDILLKLKQEMQYNGRSFSPIMMRAANEVSSWYEYNGIQQNGIFMPYNPNYYNQGQPYYGYTYPYNNIAVTPY